MQPTMADYRREFIEFMVEAGVLTFGDFVTKSGRRTPYFINTGNYRTGAHIARLGQYYARCIAAHIPGRIDTLFGPAYKGIPLAVAAASALAGQGRDVGFCFNRKEVKDHGEGGVMVGHKLKDGDRVVIVEDVITAGTAMRECLPVLQAAAKVEVAGLVVSVDRQERGAHGDRSAIQEIAAAYGIPTYPLVTVRDILDTLRGREIGGRVVLDEDTAARMETYLDTYGVRA